MATLKQKRALAIAAENGGKISTAMRAAGYSPETAKNPSKLTKSNAWQKLMQKHLPDSKLASLHKKLLEKKEIVVVGDGKGESHWEFTEQPHSDSLRALELAHKLKGRPNADPQGNTTNVQINILNYGGDHNPAPVRAEAVPAPAARGD